LIPLLPLAALSSGVVRQEVFRPLVRRCRTGAVLISTVLSLWTAYRYFLSRGGGAYRPVIALKAAWLSFSPGLSIDMSIILDPISVMMIVVVSFISLMVHIFSLGYMKGEARFGTYYAFLGLSPFHAGAGAVREYFRDLYSGNWLGCSSFLLIGYYFDRRRPSLRLKKHSSSRVLPTWGPYRITDPLFHAETLDFAL